MEYFSPTKIREIKNLSQNKTKPISKRDKDRVGKELERDFGFLVWIKFFCYFF